MNASEAAVQNGAAEAKSAAAAAAAGGVRAWPAILIGALALAIWWLLCSANWLPEYVFPSPQSVARAFAEDMRSGRLFDDAVVSFYRVTLGFGLAVALGVPAGLLLGTRLIVREGLLPAVNFFRSLSPLAWIPFAILWFGIGDAPAVFLIFMASFFPLVLALSGAVATVPKVYFQVGAEYGYRGARALWYVTLPAILPQLITALRVGAGLAWLVVVAAEMVAGREGLGFAIWDARNGLRIDLLVCRMITIGCIGITIDLALLQLTRLNCVRWGYER
ncbi:MAG: ABC transporter permease [Rhodocyclaceae bacterium]|nr:ABC transporter permease [Rhodocyclaceae bacterium]